MAGLNLYFINDNGKTRSEIGVKKNLNKIEIHNEDAQKKLTITFIPASAVERKDRQPMPGGKLEVPPQQQVEIRFTGNPKVGDRVRYEAKLDGTTAEDPIIIVD